MIGTSRYIPVSYRKTPLLRVEGDELVAVKVSSERLSLAQVVDK